MICEFLVILFFRNKNLKMSDHRLHIPSGGIGEIEFDNDWFQTENTEIYMDKAIPLFHLISHLMSLIEKYHRNLARIG